MAYVLSLVVQGLWLFYLNVFVPFFLEQRPQNVTCSTGVSVSAALGLHHQDQVWEQHNHTEVGHTILTQSYRFTKISYIYAKCTQTRIRKTLNHRHTIIGGGKPLTNVYKKTRNFSCITILSHIISFPLTVVSSVLLQHFSRRALAAWCPGTPPSTSSLRSFSLSLR